MRRLLCVVFTSVFASLVFGQEIPVEKPGGSKLSLDLSGLKAQGGAGTTFYNTLANDLMLSGWFKVVADGRGAISVAGQCSEAGGNLSVPCNVRNVSLGKEYINQTYSDQAANARKLAHKLADDIVFAIKQVKGIASTRIVMVGMVKGKKDLYMCDADGGNMMQITKDGVVCLAPKWSPAGDKVAYTSYKSGYPDVYTIDMKNYSRQRVSAFPGMNTGGAFSPDGGSVALSLSKDGNPEIYVMALGGGRVTRVTNTKSVAEASPSWSPDGRRLVYTSNAAGLPHLYIADLSGRQTRITFQGTEDVAPDWGAGGIVYCSRRAGRYQICVYDPEKGKDVQQVTADGIDSEDPSWAPDGRHIVCSRTSGYHSDLYILDTLGDPPIRLTRLQGEWYSPAWSKK